MLKKVTVCHHNVLNLQKILTISSANQSMHHNVPGFGGGNYTDDKEKPR